MRGLESPVPRGEVHGLVEAQHQIGRAARDVEHGQAAPSPELGPRAAVVDRHRLDALSRNRHGLRQQVLVAYDQAVRHHREAVVLASRSPDSAAAPATEGIDADREGQTQQPRADGGVAAVHRGLERDREEEPGERVLGGGRGQAEERIAHAPRGPALQPEVNGGLVVGRQRQWTT